MFINITNNLFQAIKLYVKYCKKNWNLQLLMTKVLKKARVRKNVNILKYFIIIIYYISYNMIYNIPDKLSLASKVVYSNTPNLTCGSKSCNTTPKFVLVSKFYPGMINTKYYLVTILPVWYCTSTGEALHLFQLPCIQQSSLGHLPSFNLNNNNNTHIKLEYTYWCLTHI